MIQPDYTFVAMAVLRTEGLGMGMTEKQSEKYVESNYIERSKIIEKTYLDWIIKNSYR